MTHISTVHRYFSVKPGREREEVFSKCLQGKVNFILNEDDLVNIIPLHLKFSQVTKVII